MSCRAGESWPATSALHDLLNEALSYGPEAPPILDSAEATTSATKGVDSTSQTSELELYTVEPTEDPMLASIGFYLDAYRDDLRWTHWYPAAETLPERVVIGDSDDDPLRVETPIRATTWKCGCCPGSSPRGSPSMTTATRSMRTATKWAAAGITKGWRIYAGDLRALHDLLNEVLPYED